ncbi:hypothetical protein B296_00017433 [Ensete ventricosum]|uniref:Uncharacterized protein n=1 Tax=Ensete ventricosum TaxID=4639 RepID=A0A427AFK6_ENSVE|nr:hypothetical protein B296_00017433 [Ensete ventricosum]
MARPFARATDHGHTPCRGGRPRPYHLQGWQAMAAPLQGWPTAAKAAGAIASKRRHNRPWPGRKWRLYVERRRRRSKGKEG